MLNWILALAAVVLWVGPFAWYFKPQILTFWVRRHDKWFRGN